MIGGFFAILDDIVLLLDDTAAATKMATQKTAGILVDDLAVNANKSANFSANRELYVLFQIAKGSLFNKIIILPLAFLLSYFLPSLIIPILLLGGAYLSFEGMENIKHYIKHRKDKKEKIKEVIIKKSEEELLKEEKAKIKSAIFTDFILSIEIVFLALGTVINQPFATQLIVVSIVALIATIAVYGIVGILIRLDDVGIWLIKKDIKKVGLFLVNALPKIIVFLSVAGTLAMLLVGGSLFVHNIHDLHILIDQNINLLLGEFLVGCTVGFILVTIFELGHRLQNSYKK